MAAEEGGQHSLLRPRTDALVKQLRCVIARRSNATYKSARNSHSCHRRRGSSRSLDINFTFGLPRIMPESSQQIFATQRVRLVKLANVPVRYAYDWLTDYRPQDGRFSRLHPRYRVLRLAKDRVVRIRIHQDESRDTHVAVDMIRVSPPDRWHVDQIDEDDFNTGDFKLTAVTPRKTRIEVAILERWMTPTHPSRSELRDRLDVYWDRIIEGLESDYREGRTATG